MITDIGTRMRRQTGELKETLWLYQRFSLDIQRGNAATVMTAVLDSASNHASRWPPTDPTHPRPLVKF